MSGTSASLFSVPVSAVRTRPASAGLVASWTALLVGALSASLFADVLRVPGDHATIQRAVDFARDGDTVLVGPGEYVITEPIDFNRLHRPDDPAGPPLKNITVRSAEGPNRTVIRMSSTPFEPERASVVVFEKGEDRRSVLEGMTLTGGSGTGSLRMREGGGVLVRNGSSPLLKDCVIERSIDLPIRGFRIDGGGVYCADAAPTFVGCTIAGNSGDGVFCRNAAPRIKECVIAENSGAGVHCEDASPRLTSCTLTGNSRGLYVTGKAAAPVLADCAISRNAREGMLSTTESSPELSGSTIAGNTTGVFSNGGSTPTLVHSRISENATAGVRSVGDAFPALDHATVWGNGRHGIRFESGGMVRSSIVWANGRESVVAAEEVLPDVLIVHSCIEEGLRRWPGNGNIEAEPLFCGWKSGDVRVDPLALPPGDGSVKSPFASLERAVDATEDYSLALSRASPCVGTGEDGTNMGADLGFCDTRTPDRLVRLAPGTYRLEGALDLPRGVSIEGSGRQETRVEGPITGLRTGQTIARIALSAKNATALRVPPDEAPEVVECSISDSRDGLFCDAGSTPTVIGSMIRGNSNYGVACADGSSPTLRDCLIEGNLHGVSCGESSDARLDHATVAGNSAYGIRLGRNSSADVVSSIVWDNLAGSVRVPQGARLEARFSSIEGEAVWPGPGNIRRSPEFCGWDAPSVHVDAAHPAPGDGSETSPFSDLDAAVDARRGYSFSLSSGSPCLGSGEGGSDMGADLGTCDRLPRPRRIVILAPGSYRLDSGTISRLGSVFELANVLQRVSLVGAGAERTRIEGTLTGLRTGATLSRLTVGGLVTTHGEAPEVSDTTIVSRLTCLDSSSPTLTDCSMGGVRSEDDAAPRVVRSVMRGVACMDRSTPRFEGSTIRGGGIGCWAKSKPTFRDTVITDCRDAGVMLFQESSGTFISCRISGSGAPGIRMNHGSSATLIDCVIARNRAAGVFSSSTSGLKLTRSTVTANWDKGIRLTAEGSALVKSSIVWDNATGSIALEEEARLDIAFSCIEGEEAWPGTGNIDDDPLFCGWDAADVRVDALAPERGDGSAGRPFRRLVEALDPRGYSLSLSRRSPCRGAGEGGSDMGATTGTCETRGSRRRLVHLEAGSYETGGRDLAHHVSLRGVEGETTIRDTITGLRTGAVLEGLTIATGSTGISIPFPVAPVIRRSTVSNNATGIACQNGAQPRIESSTIAGNSWAGISVRGGSRPEITDCALTENGTGARFINGGGSLIDCTIARNARSGLHVDSFRNHRTQQPFSVLLTRCAILENGESTRHDSGVFCRQRASVVLQECTIARNAGDGVLCTWSKTSVRLTDSVIEENLGAGLRCVSATAVLERCAVERNGAASGTGGVHCTNRSTVVIDTSIVAGNGVSAEAGAVLCEASTATIVNSAISGNGQNGILGRAESSLDVVNSTVAGNETRGVVGLDTSSVTMTNSIVWGNGSGGLSADATSTADVAFSSLEGETTWPGEGNQRLDPHFVNRGVFDYSRFRPVEIGGAAAALPAFVVETPDYRLQAGSPALDAGTPAGAPPTDLDGNARPCGSGVDMGAFEAGGCSPNRFLRGDVDASGARDMTDAIVVLLYLFRGGREPSCARSADSNDDGRVELTDVVLLLRYLFGDGSGLSEPSADCGLDRTPDRLGCAVSGNCG